MHVFIFIIIIGFIAGYVDGIAGGGGLLTVPALLSVGIPPHMTLGTNKFGATMGVFASAFTYVKKGLFNPILWSSCIIACLIGATLGAVATHFFSAESLKIILPVLIALVAIYMLIPKKIPETKQNENFKPKRLSSSISGTILGFYDGFLGPGTGSFWTTLVMAIYKLDIVAASGVARFMNFVSNVVAAITFISFSDVDYRLGICLGLSLMLGSYLGAHSAIKFGAKFIKPVFLIVVIILTLKLALVEWFK